MLSFICSITFNTAQAETLDKPLRTFSFESTFSLGCILYVSRAQWHSGRFVPVCLYCCAYQFTCMFIWYSCAAYDSPQVHFLSHTDWPKWTEKWREIRLTYVQHTMIKPRSIDSALKLWGDVSTIQPTARSLNELDKSATLCISMVDILECWIIIVIIYNRL